MARCRRWRPGWPSSPVEEEAHVSAAPQPSRPLGGSRGSETFGDETGEGKLASMQHLPVLHQSQRKSIPNHHSKSLLMYRREREAESREDHAAGQRRAIE